MNGLLLCARYALAPNLLKYCGPIHTDTLSGYMSEKLADKGLQEYLSQFETLYPYLRFIAAENGISDPFDPRVVEAYWIGNDLLSRISMKQFWGHLLQDQSLKKKIPTTMLKWVIGKVPKGALPHHSFHVLNVFLRTGHHAVAHTLLTMDSCLIGWGKVQSSKNRVLTVETQQLSYKDSQLFFQDRVIKNLAIPISSDDSFQPGEYVSYHWNSVCERVNEGQVRNLKKYTLWHLQLANQTI
ncbi:MAG TPA: DUF6390 family protein [Patescibacteria group bacterium]|nr:DUF6390 family protein [Patescibacteria group bacterium]